MDDFEQRLKGQPMRRVPEDWRGEILAACRRAKGEGRSAKSSSSFALHISSFLWPHPKAWAGLAAAWIVIVAVNVSMREPAPVTAKKASTPTPEVMVELRQQRLIYAQLIGATEQPADRPKFLPMPRSERESVMTT